MPSSAADSSALLHARVAVLAAVISAFACLLELGFGFVRSAMVAAATASGGVAVSRRLTAPYPAPKTRATVLVIILVVVVQLVGLGHPPVPTLAMVLVTASVATEIARRLAGVLYPLPKPLS